MFDKILIANRGEIACRVARTARRLGIRTVAVYSEADAAALHVATCDEAYLIGPAPARASYLRADRIVEVARACGAQAIHPGYGFLSENADFARDCTQAGMVFVGPPASAIRVMGSKGAAKDVMARAGVPLVPGYHGDAQDPDALAREAEKIGYPLLIKASAGGGGKGMRVVQSGAQFKDALAGAKREAAAGFGDDRVLLEQYVSRPRHIELQVFADSHGNLVHLFERDCSVQRRHQKVVEEAPAPGLSAARRRQMASAALAAARAVGYVNAGTVEFIVDEAGHFYFMEMNTRLQVEHAVTELITGLDLVEWQLRVAAGEPLPLTQKQLAITGHAIEARIYAEDPARGFLPAAGRIVHLRLPPASTQVRVDTGVQEGDEVGVHYDPMIAKLICWDVDRPAALRRLHAALADCEVAGPATNLALLSGLSAHPAFAAADREPTLLDTSLIERYRAQLIPEAVPAPDRVLAVAVLSELMRIDEEALIAARASGDPCSPWNLRDGWRLNQDNHHTFAFGDGTLEVSVTAHYRRNGLELELPGARLVARAERLPDGGLVAELGGERVRATVVRKGSELTVFAGGLTHRLQVREFEAVQDEEAGGRLTAPMPGSVIEVLVKEGESVERGRALMIIEAMKMEHTIVAPVAGRVAQVRFAPGEQVKEGDQLIAFEAEQE
ncbi:MAG TPA: acetyl/propionyl/methylcrotonyl-CoA carboxylase subunit alpha [Burkholderiales bacterium]|nr:acetyl/propionyl/methylcrotonyl-CoA carboxylase subunit alpha [Burkholderiales bacterium]